MLVYVRLIGRGGLSGVEVDQELAHLWWERDGLAIRLEAFNDLERARAAAGLSG